MSIEAASHHTAEWSSPRDALLKALFEVQNAMTPLAKTNTARIRTRSGDEYTYKFADLDDTYETARPLLEKAGLLVIQYQEVSAADPLNEFILITEVILVAENQYVRQYTQVPRLPNDPQRTSGFATMSRRYAMQLILGMTTEDPDGDIEAIAQQQLIKTRNKYPPLLRKAIEQDRPMDAKKLIDELSEWQYNVVWKELTSQQKNVLREWRSTAYGDKPREPEKLSEKDQRRADVRKQKEQTSD